MTIGLKDLCVVAVGTVRFLFRPCYLGTSCRADCYVTTLVPTESIFIPCAFLVSS